LPEDRDYYVTSGGIYLSQLFYACTEAADAYVNYSQYVGINMMFNDELDGMPGRQPDRVAGRGEQELVRHMAAAMGLPENHRP